MDTNYAEFRELGHLNSDKVKLNRELELYKKDFANQLIMGMGEKMVHDINHPHVPTRWEIIKFRIKRFLFRLWRVKEPKRK